MFSSKEMATTNDRLETLEEQVVELQTAIQSLSGSIMAMLRPDFNGFDAATLRQFQELLRRILVRQNEDNSQGGWSDMDSSQSTAGTDTNVALTSPVRRQPPRDPRLRRT